MNRRSSAERQIDHQRAFVSEVFHNLSQPLTALHCGLDLALARDRTVPDLRASIQNALQDAERLRQRLLLVRALSDAADPGDLSQPTDLAELLRELQQDMLPLFESAVIAVEVKIHGARIPVRGNKARLTQALFCFLEYLLRYATAGSTLRLEVRSAAKQAALTITTAACLPIAPANNGDEAAPYSCEIEMARRSFRAAGGDFTLLSAVSDQTVWRGTLLVQ